MAKKTSAGGAGTTTRRIVMQVVAPAVSGPGLNDSIRKLKDMNVLMGQFNALAAGLGASMARVVNLPQARSYQSILQQLRTANPPSLKIQDVAKAFGRDLRPEDIEQFMGRFRAGKNDLRKYFTGNLATGEFTSVPQAARFLDSLFAEQRKLAQRVLKMFPNDRTTEGTSSGPRGKARFTTDPSGRTADSTPPPPPPRPPGTVPVQEPVPVAPGTMVTMTIRGDQVVATLIPPPISLQIPGNMIQATVVGPVQATPGAGGGGAGGAGGGTGGTGGAGGGTGGGGRSRRGGGPNQTDIERLENLPVDPDELRRTITATSRDAQIAIDKALGPFAKRTEFRSSSGGLDVEKVKTVQDREKQLRTEINDRLRQEKSALDNRLRSFKGVQSTPESLRQQASEVRQTQANLEGFIRQRTPGPTQQGPVAELTRQQLGALQTRVDQLRINANNLELAAAQTELTAANLADKEAQKNLRGQLRNARTKGRRQARDAQIEAGVQAAETKRRAAILAGQQVQLRAAELQREIEQTEAQGWKLEKQAVRDTSRSTGKPGTQRESRVYSLEDQGQKYTRTFDIERGASGKPLTATLQQSQRALKATREELGLLGSDFVRNTTKVATWAASVAVLYGTLAIARRGMQAMIDTGLQTARLGQVFSGVGGSAAQVTDDVLRLAAAEGRSREEAQASAIQWARLGLSRAQVNQAVRQSLQGANVAELTAGETTEHLAAIYQAYGLQVGQLGSVLGQLNQISNTYRVTNADLLVGVSRSANVAKAAGLSFSELIGIIGAVSGVTAQSGANIGNAMKSLTVALGNPNVQQFLREKFKIEVTSGGGEDLKSMSDTLAELYVGYQNLTRAEQQSMLYKVAGKTQASRVAAVLDQYIRAQVLAINAQLNLNSAEQENAKIRATLKNQLQGLVTEWERLVNLQATNSPFAILPGVGQSLGQVTVALRNVMTLINTPMGSNVFTGMLALLTALGARLAITAMKASAGTGFLGRSIGQVRTAITSMSSTMDRSVASFARWASMLGHVTKELGASTAASYAFYSAGRTIGYGVAAAFSKISTAAKLMWTAVKASLVAMIEFLPYMAILWGATKLFNTAMEYTGNSIDRTERKMAKFNAEAERSAHAMEAAAQAAKLFDTANKALFDDNKQLRPPMQDQLTRNALIEQLGTVRFPEEAGMKVKPRGEAWVAEIKKLFGDNNFEEVSNRLKQAGFDQRDINRAERLKNIMATEREMETARTAITRLEASKGPDIWGTWFGRTREENVAELRKKLDELRGKQVQQILTDSSETDEDYRSKLETDAKHMAFLERERLIMDSIRSIFDDISGSTPLEKEYARIEALKMQESVLKRQKNELDKMEKVEATDQELPKAAARKRAEADAAEKLALEAEMELEQAEKPFGILPPNRISPEDWRRVEELKEDAERLKDEAEHLAIRAGRQRTPEQEHRRVSLAEQQRVTDEDLRKITAERESAEALMPIREQIENRERIAKEIARSEQGAFDYGDTEVERLRNREGGLRRLIDMQNAIAQSAASQQEKENALVALAQHKSALAETLLDKERARLGVIKEEFEYSRKLLGAGPSELLRRVVAERVMQRGNMTAGQFFGYSPELRQILMERQQLQQSRQFQSEANPVADVQREILEMQRSARATLNEYNRAVERHYPTATKSRAPEGSEALESAMAAQAMASFRQNTGDATVALTAFREELAVTAGKALVAFRADLAETAASLRGLVPSRGGAPYNPQAHG